MYGHTYATWDKPILKCDHGKVPVALIFHPDTPEAQIACLDDFIAVLLEDRLLPPYIISLVTGQVFNQEE